MNKTTQPIKDRKKIEELFNYLNGKNPRNYMIAKIQINTARRISDIVCLKVNDFIHPDGRLRSSINLREKKTNKATSIALNKPLQKAIYDYIQDNQIGYDEYLFPSRKESNKPLTTTQIHRIFQDAAEALHIENFGTHSLRKTWGYFCYKETRNIALIMEIFNHKSEKITLKYIGITQEDKNIMYMNIKF